MTLQVAMKDIEYSHKFMVACDGCRKQKVKCNRLRPICSVCSRRGIPCIWSETPAKKSDMKRFYDSASSNIHLFKCVKGQPNKKPALLNSPTDSQKSNTIVPDLVPDSIQTSNYSSSPDLSSRYPSSGSPDHFSAPIFPVIPLPKPNMESMVNYHDRKFIFQLLERYAIGKTPIEGLQVVKSTTTVATCRKERVHILGMDCNPIYTSVEADYGGTSSLLEIHLINLFFNQVNTFFPLINRGKFFTSLRNPKTRPSDFLLNAIYFVACPFLPLNPLYFTGCPYKLAQNYHQTAMSYLEENIQNPSLTGLQAILLLYNGECGMVEKLNAIQYKMIAQLGFSELQLEALSPEDREESLNLFWCCYLQDKICNLTRCRSFSLPKARFPLHLPNRLDLPSLTEAFPLPGAQECHLAFMGSVKVAEILDDIQTSMTHCRGSLPHVIMDLVAYFESELSKVYNHVESYFITNKIHMYSAMALVIFRLYYHMAHIHLYLSGAAIIRPYSPATAFTLQHRAMTSACAITFVTESLQVDFFRFGPLLKVNATLLAFTVHRLATKLKDISYIELGGFGIERATVTNLRNIHYRLGLILPAATIENLMVQFVTPPSDRPLRPDTISMGC